MQKMENLHGVWPIHTDDMNLHLTQISVKWFIVGYTKGGKKQAIQVNTQVSFPEIVLTDTIQNDLMQCIAIIGIWTQLMQNQKKLNHIESFNSLLRSLVVPEDHWLPLVVTFFRINIHLS